MTLKEFITEHGEEKTAYKLISNKMVRNFGLSLECLPDTCELADMVEELAEQLKEDMNNKEAIREILEQVNEDFLEQLAFG